MTAAEFLRSNLICPQDAGDLHEASDELRCEHGHAYPVVDGVPVLVVGDLPPTHAACSRDWRLEHVRGTATSTEIDGYVQSAIVETCGNLYRPLKNQLSRYPIPELNIEAVASGVFLDVGANWGRWCFAANARGYSAVGIDPDLDAARAGSRVAAQLGLDSAFVVADARRIPLRSHSVEYVHSYSVLQHFSKPDTAASLDEFARVVVPGGTVLVQLANGSGPLQLVRRLQNRRSRDVFRVRHWNLSEIAAIFDEKVGPTELSADSYLSLNAQAADIDLLRKRHRVVVNVSLALRRLSRTRPWMLTFADSVYARARRST